MDHYDVIIIGTGAGGGTLAHRAASSEITRNFERSDTQTVQPYGTDSPR
jgi:pyruvate/2-oxoglutarate dehydrogenase complex dihydrolipoamide dehydrogenase (E3) component